MLAGRSCESVAIGNIGILPVRPAGSLPTVFVYCRYPFGDQQRSATPLGAQTPGLCSGDFSRELPQKTQIILHKQADVGNVEQNHRQPVHSETESEPGPSSRIICVVAARLIDRFENGGMHHAATTDFDPLFPAL